MKLITRNTDYAIRAICMMAKNTDRLVSVTDIVKTLKIPRPFLRKILQLLNKKGIIKSYKGIGGGFKLERAPDKIFLKDVVGIFQGTLKINECFFKKTLCPNRKVCPLKKKLDKIEAYVSSELGGITVSDLIKG